MQACNPMFWRWVGILSVLLVPVAAAGCGVVDLGTLGLIVDPGAPDSDADNGDPDIPVTPDGPDEPPPPPDEPPPPPDEPPQPPDEPPPPPDVPPPPVEPPPENSYCSAVADWSPDWAEFEEQVLVLVNEHRAAGADCGSTGSFAAASPLSMNDALRCAARNHSMDMGVRDFFDHTNPDGDGPGPRLDRAGYDYTTWGENIAWGYPTPEAVVAGWMSSDGHCANIMRDSFTEIGVGYYEGNLWTQTFGDR